MSFSYVAYENSTAVNKTGNYATSFTPEMIKYMVNDQIGSTRVLLDGNGNVDWFSDYEPFGQNTNEKSFDEQTTTDQCFTSYTRDMEIGLQYAMNRYMDSSLGRFISEDPAKDGLNWYVYANNNPLRWIDPTGLGFDEDLEELEEDEDTDDETKELIDEYQEKKEELEDKLEEMQDLLEKMEDQDTWSKEDIESYKALENEINNLQQEVTDTAIDIIIGSDELLHKYETGQFSKDAGKALIKGFTSDWVEGFKTGQIMKYSGPMGLLIDKGIGIYKFLTNDPIKKIRDSLKYMKDNPGYAFGTGVYTVAKSIGIGAIVKTQMAKIPKEGQKVYRVWGDKSKPSGHSWTRTNPGDVPNYRNAAGLPVENSGSFVSEGIIKNTAGMRSRSALSLAGNKGGLDEVLVPNPQTQIKITKISGVNPNL